MPLGQNVVDDVKHPLLKMPLSKHEIFRFRISSTAIFCRVEDHIILRLGSSLDRLVKSRFLLFDLWALVRHSARFHIEDDIVGMRQGRWLRQTSLAATLDLLFPIMLLLDGRAERSMRSW